MTDDSHVDSLPNLELLLYFFNPLIRELRNVSVARHLLAIVIDAQRDALPRVDPLDFGCLEHRAELWEFNGSVFEQMG